MTKVLVTGGSGFIAGHCLLQLLAAGHAVTTTVRSAGREGEVRGWLASAGARNLDRLGFAVADLTGDAGWAAATAGCSHVLHTASPFPEGVPRNPDELIVPARDGTLRVLRAARAAGVRRVVLTSSFAAIGYGHGGARSRPYDESDWTDAAAAGVAPYVQSKTLAERAAWDWLSREGGLELAVVNPVLVLGPVLAADYASSVILIRRLLDGSVPGCPRLQMGIVDVRDVADLHLRAMTDPAAAGERFLAVSGDFLAVRDMAAILRRGLGEAGRRVPTRVLPDWLVRLGGLIDPGIRQIVPELGRVKNATADKARRLLGWTPRPAAEAILATGESLLRLGLIKR